MNRPQPGPWRLLRSTLLTGIATVFALLGHVAAGGGLPDPAVVVVAAGLLGLAVSGLADRRVRFSGLLGLLVAAQVVFHLLFSVSVHHGPAALDLGRMTAFHLVTAVLTAAALTAVDRSWRSLGRRVRRTVRPLVLPVLGPVRLSAVRTEAAVPHPAVALPGPRTRRGPPLLSK